MEVQIKRKRERLRGVARALVGRGVRQVFRLVVLRPGSRGYWL